ncbi:MAG: STAS/SEC14 domain-containing protein [Thermodesulfobacteriota bacterium]
MFKVLENGQGNFLAAEVIDEYTKEDFEAFRKAFEEKISQGNKRVNILLKIDKLDMKKIHLGAFIADASYSLKHLRQLRHLAVVGSSAFEKKLVALDGKLFNRPEKELIEKYFDVADLDKAMAWAKS